MIIKSKISKKLRNSWFFLVILSLGILFFSVVRAQGIDAGVDVVDENIGLSSNDPRVMAARIIQIFLSLLGAVTVVLIIYAGALWMMSDGNEEKISKAKRILKQTVIGLIIIFTSWSITTFILNKLIDQGQIFSSEPDGSKRTSLEAGSGALGNCTLESVYPSPDQKEVPRNTSILVTFKEPVEPDTICTDVDTNGACNGEALKTSSVSIVMGTSTTPVEAKVSMTSDKKTLVVSPNEYLGSDTGYTTYSVTLKSAITKDDSNESIFKTCASDTYIWEFEVSNKLDLTPPQIVGVFPAPDNEFDEMPAPTERRATGVIELESNPKAYKAASISSVDPDNTSMPDDGEKHINNYHGQDTTFRVSYDGTKATLFRMSGTVPINLMAADFNGRSVDFPNYFGFTLKADPQPGNVWTVNVSPEVVASAITIGQVTYTFTDNNNGNNVQVGTSAGDSADILKNKINSATQPNPDVEVITINTGTLTLRAREAGLGGNNIILKTNDPNINVTPMAGGLNNVLGLTVKDKPDQPRNSVIQIVFNEPINPLTISGSADELKDYIQVLNSKGSFIYNNGHECLDNSYCLSAECDDGKCVGDYIPGKFVASSNYQVVEFISNKECGMNGCGEKIYCLPSKAQIFITVNAAKLFECSSDTECTKFGAYKCKIDSKLNQKTCQDASSRNYPLADTQNLKGLIDLANNSLDGNANGFCSGNYVPGYTVNAVKQALPAIIPSIVSAMSDSYWWYFYTSDQLKISAPKISGNPSPISGSQPKVTDSVKIPFDTLMMASTIRTGSEEKDGIVHNYLNLWSQTPQPLGYWTSMENQDLTGGPGNSPDGWPDRSDVYIIHSNFNESVTYNAQAGSGLRDIYQNCFKPSAGGTCSATDSQSSCCFGIETDESNLDGDGNCKQ